MRNVVALGLSFCVVASACGSDAHPEYDGAIVAATTFGPVFVVLDYSYDAAGGEILLSENAIRRVEVATGHDSGRLGLDGVNTHCAPAMIDHVWCNAGGVHSLRQLDTMRSSVDNARLERATNGRFDLDVTRQGLSVTPVLHELTGSYFDETSGESLYFAVDPETLENRTLVLFEETIDHLEAVEWVSGGLVQGDFRYAVRDQLVRAPIVDPDRVYAVVNDAVTYGENAGILVADTFDARDQALTASGPESVFVIDGDTTELRISRVRSDDGTVLWTHVEPRGYIHAAAVAGTTFGFVRAAPYVEDEERTASVVGLSLETGEPIYRIEI